jgi:hypothetical protein
VSFRCEAPAPRFFSLFFYWCIFFVLIL